MPWPWYRLWDRQKGGTEKNELQRGSAPNHPRSADVNSANRPSHASSVDTSVPTSHTTYPASEQSQSFSDADLTTIEDVLCTARAAVGAAYMRGVARIAGSRRELSELNGRGGLELSALRWQPALRETFLEIVIAVQAAVEKQSSVGPSIRKKSIQQLEDMLLLMLRDPRFFENLAEFKVDDAIRCATEKMKPLQSEHRTQDDRTGFVAAQWVRGMLAYAEAHAVARVPRDEFNSARERHLILTNVSAEDGGVKILLEADRSGPADTPTKFVDVCELDDEMSAEEFELTKSLRHLLAGEGDPLTDSSYLAAFQADSSDKEEENADRIWAVLDEWARWRDSWPGRVSALPGVGSTVVGQFTFHPFVGADRPKVVVDTEPQPGWHEALENHARHAYMRRVSSTLDALRSKSVATEALCGARQLSQQLRTRTEAARMLLEAWPRGDGRGELLASPTGVGTTQVEQRGVLAEWWLAAINRAPFVLTRVFVETFVIPTTRSDGCALWYFIPEPYRKVPNVFMSHAWDGSMWDLRPPNGTTSLWIDTVAINQHPPVGSDGLVNTCSPTDVARIGTSIATIGRTCVVMPGDLPLLPFSRSWCLFEIASAKSIEFRVGWSAWSREDHAVMRAEVERCNVESAQASSETDRDVINDLVVARFGSSDAASAALRSIVIRGFAAEATAAFIPEGMDSREEEARIEDIEARGGRPHSDAKIIEIWSK